MVDGIRQVENGMTPGVDEELGQCRADRRPTVRGDKCDKLGAIPGETVGERATDRHRRIGEQVGR